MDNICTKAAARIEGLLKTADIEPNISDKGLIERLQKTNVIEPDVVDKVLANAVKLHANLDAPIPPSDEVEPIQTSIFPPNIVQPADTEITTASAALQQAKILVTQDRRATHGTMIYGFEKIARLWSAVLAGRDLAADPLEGSEVCDMMELLKIARRGAGQFNVDDYMLMVRAMPPAHLNAANKRRGVVAPGQNKKCGAIMSDIATMIILIRDDVLEFAADGKSLGKFKYGEATELYHLIKKSDEIDRPRLINNAYVRLCFEPFELAEATRSTKSPAGDSAGYERVAS